MRHLHPIRFALTPPALAVAIAFAAPALVCAQAVPEDRVFTFAIAAQALGDALNELAAATGTPVAFPQALVAGKVAPAVQGRLTVRQAMARLLAGSGLEALPQGATLIIRSAAPGAAQTLATVTVTAAADGGGDLPAPYAGGQVARGSRAGLLGNQDLMDTPFSITSYTATLIQNQQAITVADVLANDPSVRTLSYGLTNAAGAGDSFVIRGFPIQSSVLFDGVFGVAPNRTLPVETVERVEVLKGPNALLNGMAPYDAAGGAINVVPKRAGDAPLTRLTTSYQSDGVVGGHLDLGRRFGDEKRWGLRFNGTYRSGRTATQGQSVELGAATVALDYRDERVRATLDLGHQTLNNEAPLGAGGFGIADGIAIPRAPDARKRVAQDWEYAKTRNDHLLAKLEVDIAPDWTAYAAVGGSNSRYHYLSTDIYVLDTQGRALATVYDWPDFWNYRTAQGGLRGVVRTGDVRHSLNFSASLLQQKHGYTAQYYGFSSFETNIYSPPAVAAPSTAGFSSRPPLTDALRLPSLAVSDTLSLLNDRLAVTLGARWQQVKSIGYDTATGAGSTTYDERAITPVLAVLFKPARNLSLYGNYIEGLSKGDTAPIGTTNAGAVFAPVKTKQFEVGAKYDLGNMAITAALFQIQKPSGLTVANADGSFTYQVAGRQRNRGAELGVFGEAARGVRLLGGVAYTDARLTETEGRVNDGRFAPNVSRWLLTLGGEYDVAALPGLSLTGRMLATSAQYLDAANARSIPGWTRWDVGARYATRAWDRPLVLRAGIENLLGRDHWAGGSGSWLYLGKPRTLTVSATMDF